MFIATDNVVALSETGHRAFGLFSRRCLYVATYFQSKAVGEALEVEVVEGGGGQDDTEMTFWFQEVGGMKD